MLQSPVLERQANSVVTPALFDVVTTKIEAYITPCKGLSCSLLLEYASFLLSRRLTLVSTSSSLRYLWPPRRENRRALLPAVVNKSLRQTHRCGCFGCEIIRLENLLSYSPSY
jgi:hypothetical protein